MMAKNFHHKVTIGKNANGNCLQLEAAKVVKDINLKKGSSIKPSNYNYENHSKLFALANGSVKYQVVLTEILKSSGSQLLYEQLIGNDIDLAVVLLYQHFVGTDFECAQCFREIIKKHSALIDAAHEAFLQDNDALSLPDLLFGNLRQKRDPPTLPGYARVNLIKCTVLEVVDRLCEDGWQYTGCLHVYRFKEDVSALSEHQFGLDPLLDDVLIFPSSTDLNTNVMVSDGTLVLQDRAGCIPAHVLNPPPGSVVLDCCAVPGHKTNHLASLMRNQGRVIALDRNAKGLDKMKSIHQSTGVKCVDTVAQNFLTLSLDSKEVSDITMILLDPPCNAKGIPLSTDEQGISPKEPKVLKRHQKSLLRHALQFPNVQRVVYSMSSMLEEEGEEVVQEVMYDFRNDFNFLPVLPDWPHSRGSEWYLNSKSFLRVSPEEHLTSSTFVACFERRKKPMDFNCENLFECDENQACQCMDDTVTELHHEAAKILKLDLEEDNASSLIHSSKFKNLRQLFTLVSESIRYRTILKDILNRCGSPLLDEKIINKNFELASVLLFQHLIGTEFECAPRYNQLMRRHDVRIKDAYDSFLKENNTSSLTDCLRKKPGSTKGIPGLPCFARVNLMACSVQDVINILCEDGWDYVGRLPVYRFKEHVLTLSEREFGLDPLLGDVLVFPLNTDLHKDRLVKDGTLVIQERASCVPANVLNPPPGSVVLNCCASPSNSTSHLASLMRNQGRVVTLSQDAEELSKMSSVLQSTGASCVETIAQDFLTLSPFSEDMANVTMILLDPSNNCNGIPGEETPVKIPAVLKWQYISLLRHALQFPNVQRVVYYTCSNCRQINEEVVEEVLLKVKRWFQFLPVMPGWPNSRGSGWFLNHQCFLSLTPENHLTCDIFIACFERILRYDSEKLKKIQGKRKAEIKGVQMENKSECSRNNLNEDKCAIKADIQTVEQNKTVNAQYGIHTDNSGSVQEKRKHTRNSEETESKVSAKRKKVNDCVLMEPIVS